MSGSERAKLPHMIEHQRNGNALQHGCRFDDLVRPHVDLQMPAKRLDPPRHRLHRVDRGRRRDARVTQAVADAANVGGSSTTPRAFAPSRATASTVTGLLP